MLKIMKREDFLMRTLLDGVEDVVDSVRGLALQYQLSVDLRRNLAIHSVLLTLLMLV